MFVLKEYADPNCNSSTILAVYKNREDALAERDRLRASIPRKLVFDMSFQWEPYYAQDLIDVVEYKVL